jgi:3'(2'), 5'-bisphosphate nucleotidase
VNVKEPVSLEVLCEAAVEAGRQILAVYEGGGATWQKKADDSPLTEADLRAHDAIVAALAGAYPGVPLWSEEGEQPPADLTAGPFFLVDPLDGTREFLNRSGEFTVNIALIENGAPVAGVVYAPALDQLYFAAHGAGAFRRDLQGDTPLRTRVPQAGESLRLIGSRSHRSDAEAAWLQRLDRAHTFVAAGSSLKFCRIAEGAADVYPRLGPTCQWDTAAGQAILECAGGVVLDPHGCELRYGLGRPVLNSFFIALASRDIDVPSLH